MEGVRQLFRYSFPEMRVRSAGQDRQATIIVVGRTAHYGGPFKITTGASLFEDSFEFADEFTAQPLGYLGVPSGAVAGYAAQEKWHRSVEGDGSDLRTRGQRTGVRSSGWRAGRTAAHGVSDRAGRAFDRDAGSA